MPDAAASQELADAYRAFFSGDLERALARFAPDVVGVDAPEMPDAGEHHGRDAVAERLEGFTELFGDMELGDLRIEDACGSVLVVMRIRARAQVGEAPVELELVHVLALRDGLVIRLNAFFGVEAAREFACA